MNKFDLGTILTVFILFISLPLIPSNIYMIFNHFIFNIIFIIVILLAFSRNIKYGLIVLFIIGAFVIERNHRTWIWTNQQLQFTPKSPAPRMKEDEEVPMSSQVFYVNDEEPNTDSYLFKPQEDSGVNYFDPVGKSINYKTVLPSSPLGESAIKLFV
jgi:hypothetical protein